MIADRYRIIALIARGAMGEVYRAEQIQLGRLVAVKVLKPRGTRRENDEIRARFLREAAGLARLTHHNTVRILDFGVLRDPRTADASTDDDPAEDRPYLVMELVVGRTLRTVLRDGPLAPQRALRIAIQIAASLREAHQEGLLHRDLKPSNILVGVDGDGHDLVKVIDFGLVKDLSSSSEEADLTAVGLVIGTPLYVPPEVVIGSHVDARADVYGLGVLLYQMLAGRPPFPEHGEIADILRRVVVLDVAPLRSLPHLAELPPLAEWVVQRCMDKQPPRRFRDAHQALVALRAAERAVAEPEQAPASLTLSDGVVTLPDPGSGSSQAPLTAMPDGAITHSGTSQATLVPGALRASGVPIVWLLAGFSALALVVVAWLLIRPGPTATAPPEAISPPAMAIAPPTAIAPSVTPNEAPPVAPSEAPPAASTES
ncbi:MAG TPA: protein kinase, partial [Gemmatimonadales bacterium]|nr:protein kinase [Gemmatimonadales bacterium]